MAPNGRVNSNSQLTRGDASIQPLWRRYQESIPLSLPRIIIAIHNAKFTENSVKEFKLLGTDSLPEKERRVQQASCDRHPSTVRNKDKIKNVTWNVMTLY